MAQNRCKPLGKPLQCEVQQAARLPSDRRNVLYCATSIAIFSLCHIKIFLLVYWFVLPKLSADKSLWVHDLWAKRARARAETSINKQIENLRQLFSVFLFSVRHCLTISWWNLPMAQTNFHIFLCQPFKFGLAVNYSGSLGPFTI